VRTMGGLVALVRGERFGEAAESPPRGTNSAPPSKTDGTPNGLAPVLVGPAIAGLDGLLWSSLPRRLRTDANTRTVRNDSCLPKLGRSQPAVRGMCSELAGRRNSSKYVEVESCSTLVPFSSS
jgi:hypothetical protein